MFGTHFLWDTFLWAGVIVQIAMSTNKTIASDTAKLTKTQVSEGIQDGYAWSAWSSWSPCSKTCGGGISMQERKCLPRTSMGVNGTLPPPMVTVRVTRQAHNNDCLGVDKRYYECNTQPCLGNRLDVRAEQCAQYDRRPFRGKFYTWVPYIDGNFPCNLNCRPLGQHFYATLALVADGTPCTKPGSRAICVQGTCKAVGGEAILATPGAREFRCGRHLVSGLFSRPRLPLGYSYVTTVPPGACRLNITELLPSENYIALKISNGSYIMNGEFAVSVPGNYDAAGARFLYTRSAGLDQVFAYGPILQPIDIMILYTQPNPSIKYEYFTESLNGEDDTDSTDVPFIQNKHSRRHHSFDSRSYGISRHPDIAAFSKDSNEDSFEENVIGERKFVWKILSYTQCTRTCGGGVQLGKYRCVEKSSDQTRYPGTDREVSSVHCSGSPPAGRRRRCGVAPCPPRWRAAAWSTCPKCGPATRTRIVGCVQDHSRGITKISDLKCPPLKPVTVEKCNIPDCEELDAGEVRRIESKRVKPREHTDNFRQGPVYSVDVNTTDIDIGPEYSFSAAGWLYTEWSECTGWCVGGGIQTRSIRCADPSGCAPRKAPDTYKTCIPKLRCEPQDGEWFVGEWSRCSSPCHGKQIRGVLCAGGTGRHLKDSACKGPKPAHERECSIDKQCSPMWYISDWGKCLSNCSGDGSAVQRRSVVCARAGEGGVSGRGEGGEGEGGVSERACAPPAPRAHRACTPRCAHASTLPPQLVIESQKSEYETTTLADKKISNDEAKDCEDKLQNCYLAVNARLCHYNYYVQNCCESCKGR